MRRNLTGKNPGTGGWRAGKDVDACSEGCATCIEDLSMAHKAGATRAAMRALFNSEALELHASLAAQFAQRMRVDTHGGTLLPKEGRSALVVQHGLA